MTKLNIKHFTLLVGILLVAVVSFLVFPFIIPKQNQDPGDVLGEVSVIETVLVSKPESSIKQFEYGANLPAMSADGRYVVAEVDGTVIRVDTTDWSYEYVCLDSTESPVGCWDAAISGNGRYVAFVSDSSDLTAGGHDGYEDVYLTDMNTGTIYLISGGTGSSEGLSGGPSVSYDGMKVAFSSSCDDIVVDDTNGHVDVFVRDLVAGETVRASVHANGSENGQDADSSFISGNGQYVVFEGYGLTDEVSHMYANVFMRDLNAGTTEVISREFSGSECMVRSQSSSVSSDGRYVAFESQCELFIPNDYNSAYDVFVKDRTTGDFIRVSTDGSGNEVPGGGGNPVISSNGQYVVFTSDDGTLVPGDSNGTYDIFLKNISTQAITRISISYTGGDSNDYSHLPVISSTGAYVAFTSAATNLVEADSNGMADVFIRSVSSETTSVLGYTETVANSSSESPTVSDDGRYVVFSSEATNLVANDTNGVADVFVRDMVAGTTTRVSVNSSGEESDGGSSIPVISGNGRYVAFYSEATNLVETDTNGVGDVFVKDLQTGTVVLASVSTASVQADLGNVYGINISGTGRYVVFSSNATNLVDDDINNRVDVFLRDTVSNTTARVSVSSSEEEGNFDSSASNISVSDDGRYVTFESTATNLVDDDTNGVYDIFMRDVESGTTARVSLDENNNEFSYSSSSSSMSKDGAYVAFESYDGAMSRIYLRNIAASTTVEVSVNSNEEDANASSYLTSEATNIISSDGRYVVFLSVATNLVEGPIGTSQEVYIRDTLEGDTSIISTGVGGAASDGYSGGPSLSANAQYAVFYSNATNLTTDYLDPASGNYHIFRVQLGTVPAQVCGNNVIEGTEVCDGLDLNGRSCSYYDDPSREIIYRGTLRCSSDCVSFNTSGCQVVAPAPPEGGDTQSICGNALINTGEVCDTTNLDGMTCELLDMGTGTLACATDCKSFNMTACSGYGQGETSPDEPTVWDEITTDYPFLFDENKAKDSLSKESQEETIFSLKALNSGLNEILSANGTSSVMAGTAIVLSSITAAYVTGFTLSDIPALSRYGFNSVLNIFFATKKRSKLGTVYNSLKKSPISLAIVRLFKGGKLIETAVTDNNGVFMFEAPKGDYKLQVVKNGFSFPSKVILSEIDGPLTNIYRGDTINVKAKKDILTVNIPLDPSVSSEFAAKVRTIGSLISSFVSRISLPLIVLASIISVGAYFMNTIPLNLVMMLLNFAVLGISLFLSIELGRKWGFVKDSDGNSVEGIRLVLSEAEFGKVVSERFTDEQGRYSFVVPAQEYILKVEDSRYEPVDFSKTGIKIKPSQKGSFIINKSFRVRKLRS